jgi:ABC-type multidrug transport system permease subunit
MVGATVTGLNAVSRNFNSEFPAWQEVFAGKGDYHQVSILIERAGDRIKNVRRFIDPPLVGYAKEEPGKATNAAAASNGGTPGDASATKTKVNLSTDNTFAYLLIGLSGMFLLFIAGNAMSDLQRELRLRTFERYQSLRQQLWPFIVGKVLFAIVLLMVCSAVLLGGGGWMFRFQWQHPLVLVPLTLGYACFVASLFAVLVALVPDERRAGVLNSIAAMALGLVGGCAFPPRQLPAFLRDHVTPLLPSYWFVDTVRTLECGSGNAPWLAVSLKLAGLGVLLIGVAAFLFRRRFTMGLRA